MPDIRDLTLDGAPPDRFVAIASPGAPQSVLWAIDGHDEGRPKALKYLEQTRAAYSSLGPLDMTIAKRLVQFAGDARVLPGLIHMTVFALTELKGGRSVVIDTYGENGITIKALKANDYDGALAEFDRLGFEASPAPGMR